LETGIQIVQFIKQVRKKQNFQPPTLVMKEKSKLFFVHFHEGNNLFTNGSSILTNLLSKAKEPQHDTVLQPLRWRCVECVIHHKRDVCKEQHHIYVAQQATIE